jgi:hypothetical protein
MTDNMTAPEGCRDHKVLDETTIALKTVNPCGLEPQLIKLEFIIYLPKLKVVLNMNDDDIL